MLQRGSYLGKGQAIGTPGNDTVDQAQLVSGYANGWVFIEKQTPSAATTVDFDFPTGFDAFWLKVIGALPATDDVEGWIRLSDDAGVTFEADATDYTWTMHETTSNTVVGVDGDPKIVVCGSVASSGVNNAALGGINGSIFIENPASTSASTQVHWALSYIMTSGTFCRSSFGSGAIAATAANDAVRFMFESGNIASGTFTLFGLRTDQT